MAYCTRADLLGLITEAALIGLTDDHGVGMVDDAVVSEAIADADAEIDGYCGGRYPLPFTVVPAIIRKCCIDIAIYNLYSRRQGAPLDRKERRDNAVTILKEIAKGTVTLGAGAPAETTDDDVQASSPPRVFTRSTLENY